MNSDDTVLRFAAFADAHFSVANKDTVPARFEGAMKAFYAMADDDKTHPFIDAVAFVGDFVDTGYSDNYELFTDCLNKTLRDDTKVLACLGNHEYYLNKDMTDLINNGIKILDSHDAADIMTKYLGAELDTSVSINGFRFILSSLRYDIRNGKYWNDVENLDWLASELEKAAKEDTKRPIFTFAHVTFDKTIAKAVHNQYFFDHGFGAVYDIYKKYPQIINLTGHDHYPLNLENAIHQRDFTVLTAGHLQKGSVGVLDGTCGTESSQCVLVEVKKDYSVTVRPYDALNHCFMDKTWEIAEPSNKDSFIYTDERNIYKDFLLNDADVSVLNVDTGVEVSVKQITQDPNVIYYKVSAVLGDEEVKKVLIPSKVWLKEVPDSVKTRLELEAGVEYTLNITAVDSFDNRSNTVNRKILVKK
ncbi:MAG: metallophosphoesterase [Clostridia bacterium]|nr:metallophosphoesterase [Clostridia bacterium]